MPRRFHIAYKAVGRLPSVCNRRCIGKSGDHVAAPTAMVAEIHQHAAVDRRDGSDRSSAGDHDRHTLPHRAAEPLPVRALAVAAGSSSAGLGLPADPRHPRRHGYRDDPLAADQAVVGLSQPVPVPADPVDSGMPWSGSASRSWFPPRWCKSLPDSSTSSIGTGSAGTFLRSIVSWATCWSDRCCCTSASSFPTSCTACAPEYPRPTSSPRSRGTKTPHRTAMPERCPTRQLLAFRRRGVLTAAGAGIGLVVITTVGQTVTPLAPVGLLAPRRWNQGPQRVPVNRTAEQAQVGASAMAAGWVLEVVGPRPYTLTLADLEPRAVHQARFPINCVEGWSVGARLARPVATGNR